MKKLAIEVVQAMVAFVVAAVLVCTFAVRVPPVAKRVAKWWATNAEPRG